MLHFPRYSRRALRGSTALPLNVMINKFLVIDRLTKLLDLGLGRPSFVRVLSGLPEASGNMIQINCEIGLADLIAAQWDAAWELKFNAGCIKGSFEIKYNQIADHNLVWLRDNPQIHGHRDLTCELLVPHCQTPLALKYIIGKRSGRICVVIPLGRSMHKALQNDLTRGKLPNCPTIHSKSLHSMLKERCLSSKSENKGHVRVMLHVLWMSGRKFPFWLSDTRKCV